MPRLLIAIQNPKMKHYCAHSQKMLSLVLTWMLRSFWMAVAPLTQNPRFLRCQRPCNGLACIQLSLCLSHFCCQIAQNLHLQACQATPAFCILPQYSAYCSWLLNHGGRASMDIILVGKWKSYAAYTGYTCKAKMGNALRTLGASGYRIRSHSSQFRQRQRLKTLTVPRALRRIKNPRKCICPPHGDIENLKLRDLLQDDWYAY